MNRYFIKLQSLGTFFFGNENKYKKEKKKGSEQTLPDYFQRSAYFPQQTAVLGTLRYALLQKHGQIPITDKAKAEQLIGKESFQAGTEAQTYGKIKSLSPVFIWHETKGAIFQNPKDVLNKQGKPECLKNEGFFKSSMGEVPLFTNYKEKEGVSRFLMTTGGEAIDYEKTDRDEYVFIPLEKIGIKKKKTGEPDEEAYYKQILYKFNEGFSFGCYAEIDDDLDGHSEYVSMGADKSPFKMTFTKTGDSFPDKPAFPTEPGPKIVLLSDAYLPNYSISDFGFALSQTKTFRFLKTRVTEGQRYYSSNPLNGDKTAMQRSDKLNLLEAGSVFWFGHESQMKAFASMLEKQAGFYQIGYNHFFEIK